MSLNGVARRGKIRERVIRVLLNEPGGLTKYRVAKLTGSSFSWVHEYLKRLEEEGFIEGARVVDYRGLIKRWVAIRLRPERRDFAIQDPLRFLRGLDLAHALTTYRAENLVQGHLFPSRTDVYVKAEDVGAWRAALSGVGLAGGGNFRLLLDDEHVFYGSRRRDGLSMVSLPQLIVDLFSEGGVCVEAAELLLDKVVGGAVLDG